MRYLSALFLAAPLAWAQSPRPSGPADPAGADGEKAFADRYAVVIERDIFARDRPHRFIRAGEAARQERRNTTQKPPPRAEESMVITGVVEQAGVYTAFIEDGRTGTTTKAVVGDVVASGKVSKINLGGLTFECEGRSVVLDVGKTLAGGTASLPQAALAKAAPAEKGAPRVADRTADRSGDRAGGRGGRFAGRNGGRAGKASERTSEKNSERPTDPAVETVADSGTDTIAETSPDKSVEKSVEKSAVKPAEAAASGSEADLLERMRQRRLQEMKK